MMRLVALLVLFLCSADAFFILGMGKRKIEEMMVKSPSSSAAAKGSSKVNVKSSALRKASTSRPPDKKDKPLGQTYPTLLPPKIKPTELVISDKKGGLYVFEQVRSDGCRSIVDVCVDAYKPLLFQWDRSWCLTKILLLPTHTAICIRRN